MSTAATTPLFDRLIRRRRRGPRQPEPADLGTAFGMEQWLDERDHGQAAIAAPLRRPWWPRWLPGSPQR